MIYWIKMEQEIPKQVRDKLAQFQELQNQLQLTSMQKQQFILQSADIENALSALEKTGNEKIYKIAGPLLIETNKESSEKKLKEDKELTATKIKMLEKQEKKLNDKLVELRTELQSMLKPQGIMGGS